MLVRRLKIIFTTLLLVFSLSFVSLYFSVNSLIISHTMCVCEKVNVYGLPGSCVSVSVCWSVCVFVMGHTGASPFSQRWVRR